MDDEIKGIGMIVLGVVAVLGLIGLVLVFTSSKGATGNAFAAAPFEEGYAGGETLLPGSAAKLVQSVCLPPDAEGEFQKPQPAFDDRSREYWESQGFACQEV